MQVIPVVPGEHISRVPDASGLLFTRGGRYGRIIQIILDSACSVGLVQIPGGVYMVYIMMYM